MTWIPGERRFPQPKALLGLAIILIPVCMAISIWTLLIESTRLNLHTTQVSWRGPNLRIVLFSDLHVGSPGVDLEFVRKLVGTVNAQNPDIILIAGDFLIGELPGGQFIGPVEVSLELRRLHSRLGVYAVLGNHDWWYNGPHVIRSLESSGITVLEDRALRLYSTPNAFWILGISDLWTRGAHWEKGLEQIDDSEPILAITHNPDIFPTIPQRIDILLAGHTHGGQVRIPFFGRPIVPSGYGQKYAAGWVREEEKRMYVTVGIGTSVLPIRLGVPPEIALIILNNQPEQ